MKCNKCNIDQEPKNFSFRNLKLKIRKKICKGCNAKYRKKYYFEKSTEAKIYALKSNKDIYYRNQQFIWNYLKQHPCVDCNEGDPIVLEFDHIRDKKYPISTMVKNNFSIEKIKNEIEKCNVRCANCHRRKTAIDFNWYKNIEK